jgi:flagellar motor component MotA|tara:strand:+ start:936 stop:1175 length:240 start_codon:yes stop_codon:yes gene_type:complete
MTKEDVKNYTQMGVTAILTGAVVTGFFMGLIDPAAFMAVAGGAIAYYFNDRKNSKELTATVEALRAGQPKIIDLNGKEI